MLTAPKTPSMLFSSVASVAEAFVKLRQVEGDVACLVSAYKNFEYRGILKVNAINFAQMAEDEQAGVIEGFKVFLNTISFPIQVLIRNRPYNLEHYLQAIDAAKGVLAPITRDHAHFVRALAARRGLVMREFYVIVPADRQLAKDKTEALFNAQVQLKQRIEELSRRLEYVGLLGKRLTTLEIVQLYQSCYTPWEEPFAEGMREGSHDALNYRSDAELSARKFQGHAQLAVETKREKRQKAQDARKEARKQAKKNKMPAFIKVPGLVLPSDVQVFPSYIRIDRDAQREYVRTLALASYPRSVHPGWFDSIIQVNEPNIDFSIHVYPQRKELVSSRLSQKAIQFRGATLVSVRQGRTADPSITRALGDVEKLRENIAGGNEHAFTISAFIQVRGRDRRELGERSDRITRTIRSIDFRALPTHWQHHVGLMSCLPDANNPLGRGRLFGTSSAATFYPFTNSDISTETGVMFGAHPGGGLVILNPFNRQALENGNLVVLAKSGTGKSFFLKTVTSRLLPTCNVHVIDPEGEYNTLCETVKGQHIGITPDSLQINPFELYGGIGTVSSSDDAERGGMNFLREKLLNLVTLLELILSDEGMLPQKEKAILYNCLIKVYERRGITMDPSTHGRVPPTMQEFYEILSIVLRHDGRPGVGQRLSERLERCLHLFPARTQIVLDNRFIDFNLRALSDLYKPIGLFLLTEFLWIRLRQEHQSNGSLSNTILLIDEIWPLMKFQQGAKFLAELSRRMHNYGASLWCTTQNVADLLATDEGKGMVAMAALKFLMKQDSGTVDVVAQAFNLNPGQKSFLQGARRGEGLFARKSWSQMEVLASPLEVKMAHATPTKAFAPEQPGDKELEQTYQQTTEYARDTTSAFHIIADERKRSETR